MSTEIDINELDHGICKERGCEEKATIDYNGHEHWVCEYHFEKLTEYFEEEYD